MKLLGIIGKPLDHTLSPALFNAVFKKRGLPFRYLPFQVEKRHLKNLLLCMKLSDVVGLNVTRPYKEAVVPFLDRCDASAKACGAVNTIVKRGKNFIGTNTDGAGFLKAIREQCGFSARGKNVLILGAGGSARAIAGALAKARARRIFFLNRNPIRAKKALSHLQKHFPKTCWKPLPLTEADLLVQTTPVQPDISLKNLPKQALVCDIVYRPLQTPFLKKARRLRLKTMDGLCLLSHQAALNFKLWTGSAVSPPELRRILRRG